MVIFFIIVLVSLYVHSLPRRRPRSRRPPRARRAYLRRAIRRAKREDDDERTTTRLDGIARWRDVVRKKIILITRRRRERGVVVESRTHRVRRLCERHSSFERARVCGGGVARGMRLGTARRRSVGQGRPRRRTSPSDVANESISAYAV